MSNIPLCLAKIGLDIAELVLLQLGGVLNLMVVSSGEIFLRAESGHEPILSCVSERFMSFGRCFEVFFPEVSHMVVTCFVVPFGAAQ